MVLEINDQNFDQEVKNFSGVVLVDFWAPWCGPCKMQGPIIEDVSKEFSGNDKVKISKINVDDNKDKAGEFDVMSIPTLKISLIIEKSYLNNLKKVNGRNMSLINLTDINAGIEAVRLFKEPAAVIIKHNTPCGIALGKNSQEALINAIKADPHSAFGGVIILNKNIDEKS